MRSSDHVGSKGTIALALELQHKSISSNKDAQSEQIFNATIMKIHFIISNI
jgi:hypothetical protein